MWQRTEVLYNRFVGMLFIVVSMSCFNIWTLHSNVLETPVLHQYEQNQLSNPVDAAPPQSDHKINHSGNGNNFIENKSSRDEQVHIQQPNTIIINELPPRPHPHGGARYADGRWGYVADVTRVRRQFLETYSDKPPNFLPFTDNEKEIICSVEPGSGKEGFETKLGWEALLKVKINGPKAVPDLSNNCTYFDGKNTINILNEEHTSCNPSEMKRNIDDAKRPPGKLLCAVYTYAKNHELIKTSSVTWAWRCDGFLPASTITVDSPVDVGYSAVNLTHEGPEIYGNMWQKTRSILTYMHDNYIDDYDYFFIVGDDTHVIVENMRRFLDGFNIDNDEIPLFTGRYLYGIKEKHLVLGGGGYVLNRHALKRFVKEALGFKEHAVSPKEDRFMALSMRSLGIIANHSVDDRGEQRFHHMSHSDIAEAKGGKYLDFLEGLYGHKEGIDQISSESVSFHHMRNTLKMKRIHAILYRSCPKGTVIGKALAQIDGEQN